MTEGIDAIASLLEAYSVPPELLRQAVAHRSYCSEHPPQASNERLELLGDAVLGVVVTDHLYRTFPALPEGDLTRVRAAVVSSIGLAPVAASLGLGEALLLGRGEESSGGRTKGSILADALEAVIGAVYLSSGLEGATSFVIPLLAEEIDDVVSEARLGDPKNQLQEMLPRLGLSPPYYVLADHGPDHAKHFTARVVVEGHRLGSGEGGSKKLAERRAAQVALAALAESGGEISGFPIEPPARRVRDA